MKIVKLRKTDKNLVFQAAGLLVEGFRELSPEAWPDMRSAKAEVRGCLDPGRICLGMVDDSGVLLGWIGAISTYSGNAWELHPLVVRKEFQHKGIGSKLLKALESAARQKGGSTIFLGADDETGRTTLSGKNLYKDLFKKIERIRNLRKHPYEFYQKNGYMITGVIPDANGPGKPDILMAKKF